MDLRCFFFDLDGNSVIQAGWQDGGLSAGGGFTWMTESMLEALALQAESSSEASQGGSLRGECRQGTPQCGIKGRSASKNILPVD